MKRVKKIVSAFVVAALMVTTIPTMAFAEEQGTHEVDAEWYNFRNNPENNGVTDRPTPTETVETVQKWANKYGIGWAAAPTPPLVLNGKLYIGSGNQVIELDKENGNELRRSDAMIGNVGYAMNPLTYADGKLFAQVGNGVIQAIDLKTLKCVWYTEKLGGQTLCPISHTTIDGKGYIYSGTWKGEKKAGSYFCVTTDDEGLVSVDDQKGGGKKKTLKWKFTPTEDDPEVHGSKKGFYWAGAYATAKYVAVGSEDGTDEGEYTANAVFYTLNPETGEIIDAIRGIQGDIRTTTVYDNGYLYFGTKGGVLYKTKVDESGHLSETSSIDIGAVKNESVMMTAAPVVYGNKIYVGVSGKGGQFDPDGGHGFRVIDNHGDLTQDSILYNIPIPGYPQAAALASTAHVNEDFDGDGQADGRVYLYFTYNARPGGIYYCYDTADQTESKEGQSGELFVPPSGQQNYCISTICADREGTLYYKNDSCYLMAVERNPAYINNIIVSGTAGETISWNTSFDSTVSEYTLKIPETLGKIKLELDVNEGNSVTVNGNAYQQNVEISVEPGDSDLRIVVSKQEANRTYTRTYILHLNRVKTISTLESMKVGTSNTFSNFLELKPQFSPETTEYTIDTSKSEAFWRVWLKATDSNSAIKVSPVENIKRIDAVDGTPVTEGHNRWNVYKKDTSKTAEIRVDVLSEDGKQTTSYHLTLLVPIKVMEITLDKTEASIDVTNTLQLQAKVLPENATIQTVKWYSSDDEVAVVNESGLVTPKKAGTVDITVISDDGASKNTKCTLQITDKAADVDGLIEEIGTVTLESKAVIDIARDAYEELNDAQKARVQKLQILEEAEKEYAKLQAEAEKEEADKKAAEAVDALIDAIGEVSLESKEAIEKARTAYDMLTLEQKEKVTKIEELQNAEELYHALNFEKQKEELKKELALYKDLNAYRSEQQEEIKAILNEAENAIQAAETEQKINEIAEDTRAKLDQVKTDAQLTEEEKIEKEVSYVEEQISNIGDVQFNLESRNAIAFARVAYDKLEDFSRSKVKNVQMLIDAEEKWENIVENASLKTVKDEKTGITISGKLMDDFAFYVKDVSDEEKEKLRTAFENDTVSVEKIFTSYAILNEGGYIGDLIIKFPVDKKYEGREIVGKQLLEDDIIKTQVVNVRDHVAEYKVNKLGAFMIAVKEVKHMNQEELNTDNSNENNNQGGKGYLTVPKTGDNANIRFLLSAILGVTVLLTLFRRKKRRY